MRGVVAKEDEEREAPTLAQAAAFGPRTPGQTVQAIRPKSSMHNACNAEEQKLHFVRQDIEGRFACQTTRN